jgi:hypothetical protein
VKLPAIYFRMAFVFLILTASRSAPAQTVAAPSPAPKPIAGSINAHADWPAPRPQDVRTVESIVAALYDVISGPAGQQRDWNRMRSLFVPDAKLIPVRVLPGSPNTAHPATDAIYFTLDDYIARSGATMTANGFFEQGIRNEVREFGNMVDIFSTYESRHTSSDAKPFARGINSIQLLRDGERYWIVNVFWDAERPSNPIPKQYLP